MLKNAFNTSKKYGARLAAFGAASMALASSARADMLPILEAVTLDGVVVALVALCLIVVAIALTMKGPDVAKRIIRKV